VLFEGYGFVDRLQSNIESAGLRRPTDIQYRAIPVALRGDDLLAIAQTGTGKTLAFALPIIEMLAREPKGCIGYAPRAMVMVPTHELARQIYTVFTRMAKGTGVVPFCLVGGYTIEEQVRALPERVDVVIGTPGRVHDLARNDYVRFDALRVLVFDEADRMLELGFRRDIDSLLRMMPYRRQTLFFSATIGPEIKRLAHRLVRDAIRIEIAPETRIPATISHSLVEVPSDKKRFLLERIIVQHKDQKILVFVRTQVRVERVVKALERVGLTAIKMHGGLERSERNEALSHFVDGEERIMVTTDVSARGLDIPGVEVVVNYDMPSEAETYVHRVGRTGRGKNKGVAISFCSEEERSRLAEIEGLLGGKLPRVRMPIEEDMAEIDFLGGIESDWKALIEKDREARAALARAKRRKKR
jgi:DEAD/DEAH box helicase domain protein